MTREEVCEKYGVSDSSLKTNYRRTQQAILKKYGVKIEKEGRGEYATYREVKDVDLERAISMYKEAKDDFAITKTTLKLVNMEFCCFLGIVITPMLVFRGNFKEFAKYMEIKPTEANIAAIKSALSSLEEKGFIIYTLDYTDRTYFIASVSRKVEVEMRISLDMVKTCKKIAENHNKRSWIPFLKVWIGIQILQIQEPFTLDDICNITGLSRYQVRETKKLLEANELFRSSKAYRFGYACMGESVDLNAFYK